METNQCSGMFLEGRLNGALDRFDELSASLTQRDDQYALACCTVGRAAVLVTMGRGQEAIKCAREAVERAAGWDDPGTMGGARTEMVLALSLLGEKRQALDLLEEIAREPRVVGYQGDEDRLPELMRCAVHLGRPQLVSRLHEGMEPTMPLMADILASSGAMVAEAAGDVETAVAGYADAASRWHDFGVPYEEAQALLGQGRCLVALGRAPEAAARLAAAREIFARLGAKPALAETDELMQHAASA